jgi:hypothetical protein
VTPPGLQPGSDREVRAGAREPKLPPRRPDAPPPSRTEGIVQAILTWLDGQL